jgi:hypothetical protein
MSHTLLLLPDSLLILCGFVLYRWTALDRGVWDGVERLVYYRLFPCCCSTRSSSRRCSRARRSG